MLLSLTTDLIHKAGCIKIPSLDSLQHNSRLRNALERNDDILTNLL